MSNELDNDFLDAMLTRMAAEDMKRELDSLPSDEELEKLYPYTRKQERELRRLLRILKHKNKKPVFIYIKRAAVILLCTVTVTSGLMLTDEGVRAAVGERIKEIKENIFPLSYKAEPDDLIKEYNQEQEYYKLAFDDIPVADREAALDEFNIDDIEITYIPEGFEIRDRLKNKSEFFYSYINENNNHLLISAEMSGSEDYTVDSDSAIAEKININGNDGIILVNEEKCDGTVLWGNEIYVIHIYGQNLSKEELIKVAEGIKY